jgi:uncharacterized membrane protein
LSDEQPFAVDVPTMFTMNKVIIMLVLASIGTYSLTMLTTIIGMVQKITTPVTEENVIGSQSLPYREEDYTSKMNNNRNDIVPDISPDTALVDIEITEESESNIDKAGPLPFNKAEHKRKIASDILEGDEKKIYLIVYEKKQILQSELVLESGLSKVKVSRLLQKLENKSLLLRKPYGNTNKVIIAE